MANPPDDLEQLAQPGLHLLLGLIKLYARRDEMAATAVLDRLFHKAHIFNIDGHSYRLKDFNQTMKGAHLE